MSFVLLKDVVCNILQSCCEVSCGAVCAMCPQCLGAASCPGRVCAQAVGHCRHCSVLYWLLRRVAAHSSPLTRERHLLGQCNTFDGASVPLSREYEKENFATGVCVAEHISQQMFWRPGRLTAAA